MNKLFYGIGNAVLEYAYKTGSVWYFEDVDNVGTYSRGVPMSSNWTDEDVNKYLASQVIGVPSSFYLDASNNPVLSYYREDTKSLYLATKNPKTGTWEKKMIDAGLDSDSVVIDVSRSQKARVAYNNKYLATECGNPKTVLKSDLLYFQEETSNFLRFQPGNIWGSQCYSEKFKMLDIPLDHPVGFKYWLNQRINMLLTHDFDGISIDGFLFSDASHEDFPISLLKNGYIGIENGIARMIPSEFYQWKMMEFLDRVEIDRRQWEDETEGKSVTIYGNDYADDAPKEEGLNNYPGRTYLKADVGNNNVEEYDAPDGSIFCDIYPEKFCCIKDTDTGDYKLIPDFYLSMIVLSELRKIPQDQLIAECQKNNITPEEINLAKNYLLDQFRDELTCTPPLVEGKEFPPICESSMIIPCSESLAFCSGSAVALGGAFYLTPWTLILTAPIFAFMLIPIDGTGCVENYKVYFGNDFDFNFVGIENAPGYIEFSVKVPFIKAEGNTTGTWLGFISAELFDYDMPPVSGQT